MPLFRPARPNPAWWNLTKTLAHAVVLWTTCLALIPAIIFAAEVRTGIPHFFIPCQAWLPWLLFAAASGLGLWSGAVIAVAGQGTPLPSDTARLLVTRGPYAYVRNPMAIAGLAQAACVGVWLGSWGTLAYVFVGFAVWNWIVRPLEEDDMEQRFGDAFRRYRRAVRCWLPRWTPYSPD